MNSFPTQNQPYGHTTNLGVKAPKTKKNLFSRLNSKIAMGVIILLQVAIIGLLVYGMFVPKKTLGDQIVQEVQKVAGISKSTIPVDIVELDQAILDDLRSGNVIQEQVYKDAQSGDYVVLYEDKMVIYRRDSKQVIYNDLSPSQIAQNQQVELLNKILDNAKQNGLIPEGSEEIPQASVVDNPQDLIADNATFYAAVRAGDIVAIFPQNRVILLYSPETNTIYNSGRISTVIE